MKSRDIMLVNKYVNAFNAATTDNCTALTSAQMKAIEYVLAHDIGR